MADQGIVYIEYEQGRVAKCNLRGKQLEPGGSERARYEFFRDRTPAGSRVLDVGCNYGTLLVLLLQDKGIAAGSKAPSVGVDVDPEFVSLAKKRRMGANGPLLPLAFYTMPGEAAGEEWPEAFDVITLGEVIEHVPDPEALLASLWRALKPGGLLLLSTPNPRGFLAKMAKTNPEQHVRLVTRADLRDWAKETGYVVEEIVDLPHKDAVREDPKAHLGAALRKPELKPDPPSSPFADEAEALF